jgi:hypothetical protein
MNSWPMDQQCNMPRHALADPLLRLSPDTATVLRG